MNWRWTSPASGYSIVRNIIRFCLSALEMTVWTWLLLTPVRNYFSDIVWNRNVVSSFRFALLSMRFEKWRQTGAAKWNRNKTPVGPRDSWPRSTDVKLVFLLDSSIIYVFVEVDVDCVTLRQYYSMAFVDSLADTPISMDMEYICN